MASTLVRISCGTDDDLSTVRLEDRDCSPFTPGLYLKA
jgi:hypothetical protein